MDTEGFAEAEMPKKEVIKVNLAAANPNLSPATRLGNLVFVAYNFPNFAFPSFGRTPPSSAAASPSSPFVVWISDGLNVIISAWIV
jgi:hypothetical protein